MKLWVGALVFGLLAVCVGVFCMSCTTPEDAAKISEGLRRSEVALAKIAVIAKELNTERETLTGKVNAVLKAIEEGRTPAAEGAVLVKTINDRKDDIARELASLEVETKNIGKSMAELKAIKEKGGYSWLQMLGGALFGSSGGGVLGLLLTRLTRGPSSKRYKDPAGRITDEGRFRVETAKT
jgi:predicted transcriptional regulator